MTGQRTSQSERGRIPRARIAVLGVITIAVYGSWYYAFGVLLDPIISDTGWSEPSVATAFGASAFIGGVGSLFGGWLLDRLGSRLVFFVAAALGGGSLIVAANANSILLFTMAGAVGGGALGALGFYHVTQTSAVRISPGSEDRAIAVLTIWGAFASAIYIPTTAFLVTRLDWRTTLQVLALSAMVALAVGVVAIDTRDRSDGERPRYLGDMGAALRTWRARRFLVSQALAGVGVGTILVYQVPAMTSAGLALGAASFWAGFRGFAQLGGRLPLMPIVRKLGVAGSLRLAYAAIAVGSLALSLAGNHVLAAVYGITAGFGIGAVSPLVGMHSRNVFGPSSLGTAMGLVSLMFYLASAVGPIAAAVVADATGSRSIPVAVSACLVLVSAAVVRRTD